MSNFRFGNGAAKRTRHFKSLFFDWNEISMLDKIGNMWYNI